MTSSLFPKWWPHEWDLSDFRKTSDGVKSCKGDWVAIQGQSWPATATWAMWTDIILEQEHTIRIQLD